MNWIPDILRRPPLSQPAPRKKIFLSDRAVRFAGVSDYWPSGKIIDAMLMAAGASFEEATGPKASMKVVGPNDELGHEWIFYAKPSNK